MMMIDRIVFKFMNGDIIIIIILFYHLYADLILIRR